jgi:hypothetical protein
MQGAKRGGDSFPIVVQILGDKDEFVARKDETDTAISTGFFFLSAGAATHSSILHVEKSGRPRKAISDALTLDASHLKEIASRNVVRDPLRERVAHIVFVRHGIRDDNGWATPLREALCRRAATAGAPCWDHNPGAGTGPLTEVNIDSYGYFGMLPFLFESIRREKMRDFMDTYVEALAAAHDPDIRVDFLGHSNGTYVLAAGLKEYHTLKVNRVMFANSVVNRAYPWASHELQLQVTGAIRNYTGASDVVVAVFPRLFELHPWLGDLGSAGFSGFTTGKGADGNVTVAGFHGAGIDRKRWPSIAEFFFAQDPPPLEDSLEKNGFVSFLWSVPYLGWLAALAIAGLLGWGIFTGMAKLMGRGLPNVKPVVRVAVQLGVSVAVILMLLIRI